MKALAKLLEIFNFQMDVQESFKCTRVCKVVKDGTVFVRAVLVKLIVKLCAEILAVL